MRCFLTSLALLAGFGAVQPGEYCDDFEDGELGPFWGTSELDSRGEWKATSYRDLNSSIPDFPVPAEGETVAYLTPDPYQIYVYARLQMTTGYVFLEGSSVSLRYWLRTDYPGSGTLEIRRQVGSTEEKEPLLSLSQTSGPNNTRWMEANVTVPYSSTEQKIIIFGACANHPQNNIAVDDIKICGPHGLDQKCYPMSTTTGFPTSTETSTTAESPSTTEIWSTEISTTTQTWSTESPSTTETWPTERSTTETSNPTSPVTSPAPPTPGEYCDDFETDDFGLFWRQSGLDTGGRWEPSSYLALQETVPDFPAPASGDTLLYLTLSEGSSFAAARLEMTTELVFPEGSSVSFRYWLRSQWPASAALFVKRAVEEEEDRDPLLDLTDTAGPDNGQWSEATVDIPADTRRAKIIIFGSCGNEPMDNIAIDDIRICGPQGLDHKCVPATLSGH